MPTISKINLSELKTGFRLDSEFYQPDYIFLEKELQAFCCKKIRHFAKVTDGEHGSVKLRDNGIKYLTAENVKKGFVDITKVRYVDEEVDRRNARATVRIGDVLISIKGTLGEVAVAEDWLLPANMNRDVAIIKPFVKSEILSEYLTIFLMSKFGSFQAKREGSGGVQQMITLGRLREFQIPIISVTDQEEIKYLYQTSLNKKREAENLNTQATQLLDEALGLNHIQFKKEKSYKACLSEIVLRNRFDGEHFQRKYKQIKNQIRQFKYGWEPFLLNVSFQKPNIDPSKLPNQKFNYVELSDINQTMGTINEITPIKAKYLPSRARRIVQNGDVIASSVVGSVEKAALVSDSENEYLASTGFFHFKSSYYSPEFLLMLVKNKFFKEQLFQESTGGILSAVPESNLLHIIIPKFPTDIQSQVTELVKQSHKEYRESKQLLEQAKNEVETLIEQAAHQS